MASIKRFQPQEAVLRIGFSLLHASSDKKLSFIKTSKPSIFPSISGGIMQACRDNRHSL
jgi:hypothetical protein